MQIMSKELDTHIMYQKWQQKWSCNNRTASAWIAFEMYQGQH